MSKSVDCCGESDMILIERGATIHELPLKKHYIVERLYSQWKAKQLW